MGEPLEEFNDTVEIDIDSPAYQMIKQAAYERKLPLRIEALRAASRVVAGHKIDLPQYHAYETPNSTMRDSTLWLAEQFAKWLEDGKRDG